jgi:hypothetical protein
VGGGWEEIGGGGGERERESRMRLVSMQKPSDGVYSTLSVCEGGGRGGGSMKREGDLSVCEAKGWCV